MADQNLGGLGQAALPLLGTDEFVLSRDGIILLRRTLADLPVAQEVLTARGNRSNLNARITGISNYAGANPGSPVVGNFYDQSLRGAVAGTFALSANRFQAMPFMTSSRLRIDQLGIAVTTLGAGVLGRCFIYEADQNTFLPTNRVYQGALELDCGSTGFKAHALDFTFDADRVYWLGVNVTGAVTIRGIATAAVLSFGPDSADGTSYRTGFSKTGFSTGVDLPASNPVAAADLMNLGTNTPTLRMRAAAL